MFHKASNPASVRVATALKQASANATAAATEDQASNDPIKHRAEFDLNITEDPPTSDQIQTILGYVGQSGIPNIIKGARTENEAMRKFKESVDNFQRPVVRLADLMDSTEVSPLSWNPAADMDTDRRLEQWPSCCWQRRVGHSQDGQCHPERGSIKQTENGRDEPDRPSEFVQHKG